ncbi:MAG: hypothetical protein KAU03_00380, partial [Candidatus Altiarchaeales archaeon]|nr:hypothetical protein [Candidatus Altiarchaeales archaeon]
VNSEDWVDVYSAIMYANLIGKPFNFITSREHSARLLSLISSKNVYLIESGKVPFVMGYKGTLEGKGFSVEDMISSDGKTLNLELAGYLDTNNFVVIGDTYGYEAVSVCPYAVVSKSYVLFADKENVEDIYDFLKGKGAKILIYGHLDEKIRERLEEFEPEVIDYGDKFDNNIEIVKRYREIRSVDQVTLTSGDFMELGLMKGMEPILFIGKESVPEQVVAYVKSSGIKVGVLIGNELTRSAQLLKARTGVSVFLKFGQGSGTGAGSAAIRDLDLLYLPSYPLNVTVKDIAFNMLTSKLEVIYKNEVDAFSYFKSSIKVYVGDELVQTVGEKEPVLIDAKKERGSAYSVDLAGYDLRASELKADVFLQYGENKKSMERKLEEELDIDLVEVEDLSDIEILALAYDKDKDLLILKLKNNGLSCYVKPILTLTIKGDEMTIGGMDAYFINEKVAKDISFEVELSEEDLMT